MKNTENIKQHLKGPVFSIITPFDKEENIDFGCLRNYISFLYEGGARKFYVMGYNSRFSELSYDEIKSLNQFVVDECKTIDPENIVIVADPLHCSTKVTIQFCEHARKIGADVISLIFREKYYFEEQVYDHYKIVTENTDMPLLVHEMPFTSGLDGTMIDWPVSLLDKLADLDNVIAIKEDAKNDKYSEELINLLKDRVSIIISGGGKERWLKFAGLGCQSWLNGIAAVEPRLAINFYNAYLNGDKEFCMNLINKIEKPFFNKCVSVYGWHLAIKSALETLNIMPRCERMPMQALPDRNHEKVKAVIKSLPFSEFN